MVLYDFIEQEAGRTFTDTLFDDIISTTFINDGKLIVMGIATQPVSSLTIDGLSTHVRKHYADTFNVAQNVRFMASDINILGANNSLDIVGANAKTLYSFAPTTSTVFCPLDFSSGLTTLKDLTCQDETVGKLTTVHGKLLVANAFATTDVVCKANVRTHALNAGYMVINGPSQAQQLNLHNTQNDFGDQLVIHNDLVFKGGALLKELPITTKDVSRFQDDVFVFGKTTVHTDLVANNNMETTASSMFGALTVKGSTTMRRFLKNHSFTVVAGNLDVMGPFSVFDDSLNVSGNYRSTLNLTVSNELRTNGAYNASGPVETMTMSVQQTMNAANVTLSGFNFTESTDANIRGSLFVAKRTYAPSLRIIGRLLATSLAVGSDIAVKDLSVGNDLASPVVSASGDISCTGTMDITNLSKSATPLDISGNSAVAGTCTVASGTVVSNAMNTRSLDAQSPVAFKSDLSMGATLALQMGMTIAKSLKSFQDARMRNALAVVGRMRAKHLAQTGNLTNARNGFVLRSIDMQSIIANGSSIVTGTCTTNDNLAITRDLDVQGTMISNFVDVVPKKTFVGGTVTVNSNKRAQPLSLLVSGNIAVKADAIILANAVVDNYGAVGGTLTVRDNALIQAGSDVAGDAQTGTLTAVQGAKIGEDLTTGSFRVVGDIRASGGANMANDLRDNGDTNIKGDLVVTGTYANDKPVKLGSLTTDSWATFAEKVDVAKDVSVVHNVDIDNGLTVGGKTTISQTFQVDKPFVVQRNAHSGSLSVTDGGVVLGDATCAATDKLNSVADLPGGVDVRKGSLFVNIDPRLNTPTGNVVIGGKLEELGKSVFQADTTFEGPFVANFANLEFATDLNIFGNTTASVLTPIGKLQAESGVVTGALQAQTLYVDSDCVVVGACTASSAAITGDMFTAGPLTAGSVRASAFNSGTSLKCMSSLTIREGPNSLRDVVSSSSVAVIGYQYCTDAKTSGPLTAGAATTGTCNVDKNTNITGGIIVSNNSTIDDDVTINVPAGKQQRFRNVITSTTKTLTCSNPAMFDGDVEVDVLDINGNYVSVTKEAFINQDLVIVTAHFNENLKWLKKARVPVVVCSKLNAETPALPADPKCTITNNGREASVYLKFIISNYDNLPKHVAFIHGHQTSYHQMLPFGLLSAIQDCALIDEYDYIPLSNSYFDRYAWKEDPRMEMLRKMWDDVFRPYLHRDFPNKLIHDCCAQFIVSRTLILKHPKRAYEHWFSLFNNDKFYNMYGYDDYEIAVMFEYIWHIIFGEPDFVHNNMHKFKDACRVSSS
eukprot:gene19539-26220_t